MLKLSNKEWREFFIGGENGIFNISSSSSSIDKNKLEVNEEDSLIPYITRTDVSNGINQFISEKQKNKYKLDGGNVITIGLDTQTVFYQSHKFYTGQNIQVLRHKNINEFNASFLIPIIKVQMQKFNWGGNGATLGRLFKTKLMLPINQEGHIDWDFMEQYTKFIIDKKLNKYIKYAELILDSLECKEISKLHEKEWKEFSINEVAYIFSGKDIYEAERVKGDTPYISSTSQNNGIGYFVDNKNQTLQKNCLSVNRNGSVGYSFFHPYLALFSNDCRKLKLKHNAEYIGFFIANQIALQKEKYNYGYKMGTARLKRQKIILPVNETNEPDYEYMEQYIKNIEYKKIKQYLDYLEAKNKQ